MIRLLLVVGLAYLAWLGVEGLMGRLRLSAGVTRRPLRPQAPEAGAAGETLVRCDGCGVHVPRSRAVAGESEVFCSDACRPLTP
ncbi:MAG TPA: PP0621 family protein [Thermoanaerobaculia bacterium]